MNDDSVLIVCNPGVIRRMIAIALDTAGCYGQMEEAVDGTEAIYMLTHGVRPTLIITDTDMPCTDGTTLAKKVRELPRHRGTPILAVTSRCNKSTACADCEKIGADAIIRKPFTVKELYEVVDNLTHNACSKSEAVCAYKKDLEEEFS